MNKLLSTPEQLAEISTVLKGYLKLPFSADHVPGALLEKVIAEVRGGEVLGTYDFVDVINRDLKIGWQVKSTKESTTVTWKRAKIPNASDLIEDSHRSTEGLKNLGDAIIDLCNSHAHESMDIYGLEGIAFARLIVHAGRHMTYYEKLLCTNENPDIFDKDEFVWRWSRQKKTKKKEQLPALHGMHIGSGEKMFAWHGLGENQLHFSGERHWWPETGENSIEFQFPKQKLSLKGLMEIISRES